MAHTVSHVSDKVEILSLLTTEQSVNGLDKHVDDVDVLPLVEAADVVCVSHLALMEDKVDGTCVVLHVEPVADVEALAVDGKRLAMADIVDEERDELLRELVRTIVVRAVGHDGRHAVGVVESAYEMVARCL